jgi:hypothetical protein
MIVLACRTAAASEASKTISGENAVSRTVLIHQTQDQGVETVRPRAGRDD